MKELKPALILRILGSLLSFPISLLLFCFVAGTFDFITKINFENNFARFVLLLVVLFENIFIWLDYEFKK